MSFISEVNTLKDDPSPSPASTFRLLFFQAELAKARGWFGLDDVIRGIAEKMERRHPWVFGDESAGDAEDALHRWEAQKAKEKQARGALGGVPVALPALLWSLFARKRLELLP